MSRRPSLIAAQQRYDAKPERKARPQVLIRLTEEDAGKLDKARGSRSRSEYIRAAMMAAIKAAPVGNDEAPAKKRKRAP